MLGTDDPICIIGGGSSGLVTAKALLSEGFADITIYERREDIGGVWLFDEKDEQKENDHSSKEGPEPKKWPSPMYKNLVGNIWYKLLELDDHHFPPGTPNFPTRQQMQAYLKDYAKELLPLIKTCRHIVDVSKQDSQWKVIVEDTVSRAIESKHYAAVVCACGIYDTPDTPNIPGLAGIAASSTHSSKPDHNEIFHSKYYRSPHIFSNQRLLVLGNGPSGIDISAQAADYAESPIYRAIHGPPEHACLPDQRIVDISPVSAFSRDEHNRIKATLTDGRKISGIDRVIVSTGYRHSYPFLASLNKTDGEELITNGNRVRGLYKHIFYRKDPTLVFVGLLIAAIPFPIAEAQALTLSRVFSGRLMLPGTDLMAEDEYARLRETGDTYKFHKMRYPLDADYGNSLREWCETSQPRKEKEKLPVEWNEERRRWRRENLAMKTEQLKQARDGGLRSNGDAHKVSNSPQALHPHAKVFENGYVSSSIAT